MDFRLQHLHLDSLNSWHYFANFLKISESFYKSIGEIEMIAGNGR